MSATSQSITVRIPHADRDAMDQLAAARGVNRSDLFREAVSQVLAEYAEGAASLPAARAAAPAGASVTRSLAPVPDLPTAADGPGGLLADTLVTVLDRLTPDLTPALEQVVAFVRAVWDAVVALFTRGVEAIEGLLAGRSGSPDRRKAALA